MFRNTNCVHCAPHCAVTARLTLTPVQIWHVILNAWNVSREPSLCVYDGVLVKWHILEEEMLGVARWLEHPFWVVQRQRGQLHTKRPVVDDRDDVYNVLAKFQVRIFNIRRDIVSFQYLLLSFTGLKIDKSNIRRSFYSHLHQLLLFNICWNIPKRLIPLFRQLYDVMFTKLEPFVISFCSPKTIHSLYSLVPFWVLYWQL